MKKIVEGLEYGDMKGLISNEISIDKYKPKIGSEEDTVVVTFTITYEEPAKAFSNFIESSDLEHLDVDVSSAANENGSFYVFVEFSRDFHLFGKINKMLQAIWHIVDKEGEWTYTAFKVPSSAKFTKENFDRDIINSAVEYRMKVLHESTKDIMRIKQLVNY